MCCARWVFLVWFALMAYPAAAQNLPGGEKQLVYLADCPDQQVDRHRLCGAFFRRAFTTVERPDELIFLRSRVRDLIRSLEDDNRRTFRAYRIWLWLLIFLGCIGAWITYRGDSSGRARLTIIAVIGLTLTAANSFGALSQFKAGFRAYTNLGVLRDDIDIELVRSVRLNKALPEARSNELQQELAAILKEYANAFENSHQLPTTLMLLGSGQSGANGGS